MQSMKHGQAVPSRRVHSCLAVPPKSHAVDQLFPCRSLKPGDYIIEVAIDDRVGYLRHYGQAPHIPTLKLLASCSSDSKSC